MIQDSRGLLYKDEVYRIIGRCMEVYNVLGSGFLEPVYQEALAREFDAADIPFKREAPLRVMYKGAPLEKEYFADFICFGKIVVELKAVSALTNGHLAQLRNYLKATGMEVGLLVNFGNDEKLEWVRRANVGVAGKNPRAPLRPESSESAESSGMRECLPSAEGSAREDVSISLAKPDKRKILADSADSSDSGVRGGQGDSSPSYQSNLHG